MSRRFWLALILLLPLAPLPSQAQSEPAPYIYYFSDKIDAFVVERADGTDTHVLGDGLMALTNPRASNFSIDGPGWSPSGQWFAWAASQDTAYGGYANKPYLVKADGSRRIALLDNLQNAVMAWAPHEDLLLVVAEWQVSEQDTIIGHMVVSLVNPAANSQRVLKNDTSVLVDYDESALSARWLDDNHAIAEYGAGMDASGLAQTGYLLVDRQGRALERHFTYVLSSAAFWINAVSASGNIAYRTDQAVVVENLITGKRVSFADADDVDLALFWSPDGRYGLLQGSKLWLLTPEQGRLELLLDSYKPLSDADTPRPPWSPDSDQALLISDNRLYHVSATGQIERLPIEISSAGESMWSWLAKGKAVILGDRQEQKSADTVYHYGLYTYDFEAGTHTVLPVELKDDPYSPVEVTSDGHSLAHMGDGAVIVDLQNKITHYISPAADGFNSAGGGEVKWSQDGQWLLTFDDGLVAGGGHYRHLGIVRADGTLARDLKSFTIAPTDVTFNWLPLQVKPEYLPPALKKPLFPQPQKVLLGTGWMTSLAWSPDGQQIAGGWTHMTVWNVETGQSTITDQPIGDGEQITWQRDTKTQQYRPVVTPIDCPKSGPYTCILARSPDGKQIVARNTERAIGVYDSASGELLRTLGEVYYPAFAYGPDGKLLVGCNSYLKPRLWDTQTWDVVATAPSTAMAAAFSPDGKQLALASAWNVELWDVATLLAGSQ